MAEVFNFIWPTATALWNLRWQVRGFIETVKDARQDQLNSRFVEGTDLPESDFREACINQTWDQQKEQFAAFLLIDIFALYESWIDNTLGDGGLQIEEGKRTSLGKALQFSNARNALLALTTDKSPMLINAFRPRLLQNPKYAEEKLENLIACYRYFKEIRNSLAHRGGIADKKAEDAYSEFASVASVSMLGVKEVPLHYPVVSGQKVKLNLRGVVGMADVIKRLITTIDIELCQAKKAEREFETRWKAINGSLPIYLPVKQREARLRQYVRKLGFPNPSATDEIEKFLKAKKLIAL